MKRSFNSSSRLFELEVNGVIIARRSRYAAIRKAAIGYVDFEIYTYARSKGNRRELPIDGNMIEQAYKLRVSGLKWAAIATTLRISEKQIQARVTKEFGTNIMKPRVDQEKLMEAYYRLGSIRKAADEMGIANSTAHALIAKKRNLVPKTTE